MFIPVVVDTVDETVVTVGTVGSEESVKRFFARFVAHVAESSLPLSDFRAFVVHGSIASFKTVDAESVCFVDDFDLQSLADEVTDNV